MNKQRYLHYAEVFDSFRIVPRIFIFCYWGFCLWFIYFFADWYMQQPANARGFEESGALFGIITSLLKFGADLWNTYARTGRDWSAAPPSVTETTVTQRTAVTPPIS